MQNATVMLLNLADSAEPQTVVLWQDFRDEHQSCCNLAWKIISRWRYGWRHPIKFSGLFLSAEDRWGNHTPPVPVSGGTVLGLSRAGRRKAFQKLAAEIGGRITLRNDLPGQVLRANLWRDQRRAAVSRFLAPGESTSFRDPEGRIRLGVVRGVKEGAALSREVIANCPTVLSLSQAATSSILLLGGGYGPTARPFFFHLTHVVARDGISNTGRAE